MVPPSKQPTVFLHVRETGVAGIKKRKLSLLQQQALMSAAGLFVRDLSPFISNSIETAQKVIAWFQLFLSAVSLALDDLPSDDANIIFLVSGYIGRSISRRRKCFACRKLLVNSNESCNIDVSIPDENKQLGLFLQVNRGGLYAPTEFIYAVTDLSVQFYTAISVDTTIKHKLFALSNQLAGFTLATTNVLKAQDQ